MSALEKLAPGAGCSPDANPTPSNGVRGSYVAPREFVLEVELRESQRLVTQLGEALAVAVEEIERRDGLPLKPDSFIAGLLVRAKREGR